MSSRARKILSSAGIGVLAVVLIILGIIAGRHSNPAPASSSPVYTPAGTASALNPPGPAGSPSVLSPQQAQAAQAQQDKDRILSSPGWQPVPALDDQLPVGDDWVGVKCSSQPPDTPPNAAIGGNLTLTIWNPGPVDQSMIINEVEFPGGGQSPINPQDINSNTVVAAGVVDVFRTSYTSLVGSWASGCYISTNTGFFH